MFNYTHHHPIPDDISLLALRASWHLLFDPHTPAHVAARKIVNGITVRDLSQQTFTTKSAMSRHTLALMFDVLLKPSASALVH
jgi:hypothetical protein